MQQKYQDALSVLQANREKMATEWVTLTASEKSARLRDYALQLQVNTLLTDQVTKLAYAPDPTIVADPEARMETARLTDRLHKHVTIGMAAGGALGGLGAHQLTRWSPSVGVAAGAVAGGMLGGASTDWQAEMEGIRQRAQIRRARLMGNSYEAHM